MSRVVESISEASEIARLRKVVARLKKLTVKYQQAELIQKALFRISELASAVQDINQFYSSCHSIIGELMFAKNFFICLYDDVDDTVQFVYFVDEYDDASTIDSFPMEVLRRGMTGYVMRTGQPFWYATGNFQELVAAGEIKDLGAAPVDWLGVPLKSNGRVIGAMVIQSYTEDQTYSQADQDLLVFVSQHIVNALDRLRQREFLQAEIARQTAELRDINRNLTIEIAERKRAEQVSSVLFSIAEMTNTSDSMSSFYRALHEQIGQLINNDNFFVALVDEERRELSFPYYVDEFDTQVQKSRPLGRGMTEYVIRHQRPVFITQETFKQLTEKDEIEATSDYGTQPLQWLGSPLIVDDEVIGVLSVQTYRKDVSYKQDDLDLLNFVSQHVAVAIERRRNSEEVKRMNAYLERKVAERTEELVDEIERRKKIEEKLYYDAHHDALTGLPNRALFTERLERVLKHKQRFPHHHFAVLFVDLDRFKDINDSLGHSAGDTFLLEASKRICACVRENDTVARLGGDEFVILLDMMQHIDDAREVASRIIQQMQKPFEHGESSHFSGASVGIAECRGEGDTAERLLRDADAAMYQAKSMGRGRYVVFDEQIHRDLVASLHSETELRHAELDQDFTIRAETIYCYAQQQPLGTELVTRWHRDGAKISEERLFALAEKTGMLVSLDHWLLQRSCEIAQAQPDTPALFVSLSSKHLYKLADVHKLEQMISDAHVAPERIVMTFSEADLNYNSKRQLSALKKLSEFGVKLALNHFGRNAGALQFILNHPFDFVILDSQFVEHATDSERSQKMIAHVVKLCEDLDIALIAAGVKSPELSDQLAQLGVNYQQGSHFGDVRHLKRNDLL